MGHIRDVTHDEGASQVRSGSTPRAMAAFREFAVSLIRLVM
ncbi:hypothetical protein [Streptomyces sp. SID12501]|nr:hypothetical protein [Streptomyces sp. SID12501]